MLDGICQGCGTAFSVALKCSTRPAPKYCTKECFRKNGFARSRAKAHASLAVKFNSVEGHKKPRTQACEICGGVIDCKPSKFRRFCGKTCAAKSMNSNKGRGQRLVVNCRRCGKSVPHSPSVERKFCSGECSVLFRQENPLLYKKPRTDTCKQCGLVLDSQPCYKRQFCSKDCVWKFRRGLPFPCSKSPHPDNPSPNKGRGTLAWQRRFARKKFGNTCSRCGFKDIPEILQVHHKDHNPRNPSEENLELLCPNCHETDHFLTKTGRFGSHERRKRKSFQDTYQFKKSASSERALAVESGLVDPGPLRAAY